MRQTKYLINEAKQNTNTTDIEAISGALCVRLLNRAQEYIRAYFFSENVESRILKGSFLFSTINGQDTYDLPANTYAVNSTNTLQQVISSGIHTRYYNIRNISEKNRGDRLGYVLSNNQIILSPVPSTKMDLALSYNIKVPSIGLSYGKVITVNPTNIILDTGFIPMTDVDDFFTVVDTLGTIIVKGLLINQSGATLTLSSTVGITAGMHVVPGVFASTHSQLPDEFEPCLIMSLEAMINARMSSTDLSVSKSMSDEMLDQIGKMYAENKGDDMMPPVVEYSEWV